MVEDLEFEVKDEVEGGDGLDILFVRDRKDNNILDKSEEYSIGGILQIWRKVILERHSLVIELGNFKQIDLFKHGMPLSRILLKFYIHWSNY